MRIDLFLGDHDFHEPVIANREGSFKNESCRLLPHYPSFPANGSGFAYLCHDAIEDAIYEGRGILGTESLGEFYGFVHRNPRRNLLAVKKLKGGNPKDVAIDGRHALETPMFRVTFDEAIDLLSVSGNAPDQPIQKAILTPTG